MYKRIVILVFVLALSVVQAQAQKLNQWKRYRLELVGGLGVTTFLGELGGSDKEGTNFIRDFNFKMTRPVFNLGVRYRLRERIAVKATLNYGILRGDDSQTKQLQRRNRNLNFYSNVFELSGNLEYFFIKEKIGGRYSLKGGSQDISAYAFVGLSALWFNPYGKHKDTGEWVALQPLGTEGQGLVPTREKYSRFTLAIPYGLGMKYRLNRSWSVGLEFGIRKAFSDYLDDVSTTYFDFSKVQNVSQETIDFADPSLGEIPGQTAPNQQRGDARDYDSYSYFSITLSRKLKTAPKGLPKFTRRSW